MMKAALPIKLAIADDHEIYLDGLVSAFDKNDRYELVGVCQDGEHLLRAVLHNKPDVILTDLIMPVLGGVEAIRQLHKSNPEIRIIVLSNFDNEFMIVEALEAGAIGYITKGMPKKDLYDAIDSVYRNIPYYCKTTSNKLAKMIANSYFNPYSNLKQGLFSDTEKQIVKLICEDKGCQESADILFMSYRTVENHRARIFKKMNVKTTAGVAIYAVKHNLYFMAD